MTQHVMHELGPVLRRLHALEVGATALWREGCLAQSYRLSAELVEEIGRLSAAESVRFLTSARSGRSNGRRQCEFDTQLRDLSNMIKQLDWPQDDAHCTATHVRTLRTALGFSEAWREWTLDTLMPRRVLTRRIILASLFVVGSLGVGWGLSPPSVRVTASGRYSAEYPAKQAADGLSATEWLLPGNQSGWLELQFASSRAIRELRIKNAANRHYKDRGTRALLIEVYDGDRQVESTQVELPKPDADDLWLTLPLAVPRMDRLRFVVKSYYGLGGGIAEVELD